MSAWVVDGEHVRVLVWAGLHFRATTDLELGWYYRKKWHYLNRESAAEVGKMLMRANVASVNYRYDESTPVSYHHRAPRHTSWSVAEALKAISCYEYQSSERPGWNRSQAKIFCNALKGLLLRRVDGYDDAPWGIDSTTKPRAER